MKRLSVRKAKSYLAGATGQPGNRVAEVDPFDIEDAVLAYLETWIDDEPSSSDLRRWGFVTELEEIISEAETYAGELPPNRKPTSQRIMKAVKTLRNAGIEKGGSAEETYHQMIDAEEVLAGLNALLPNL